MTRRANPYFFELNWEIAGSNARQWGSLKRRIRSAISPIGDYYLVGPDLVGALENRVYDTDRLFDRGDDFRALEDGRRHIPGEPRVLLMSTGRKITARQSFYGVWAGGCAHFCSTHLQTIEAVILTHACTVLDETLQQGACCDPHFIDGFIGTADLCVKTNIPQIKTVFTSQALVSGTHTADALNILFRIDRDHHHDRRSSTRPYPAIQTAVVLRQGDYAASDIRGDLHVTPAHPLTEFIDMVLHSGEMHNPSDCYPDTAGSNLLARITFHPEKELSALLWFCS
jgi:hypothetical protein